MEKKHTPGPWKAHGPEFGKHNQFEHGMKAHIFAFNPGRFRIADVVGPSNRDSAKEWELNARLIAAAPDLLEACKCVVKYHREKDSGEGKLFGLDFVTTCIAAIAKTTA